MIYALTGFVFGFLIPYMARRFAKFMPATPAFALYGLLRPVKRVSRTKRSANGLYGKLIQKYLMRSLGWAITCAALSFAVKSCFTSPAAVWLTGFAWILLLLYEIDERMLLLPDVLTVPLLIGGFAYAAFVPQMFSQEAWFSTQISALGAAAGYILPMLAALFLVRKHPDAFGGGDFKLLAACGAWLGLEAVPYLILLSALIFALFCLIRRQRVGAYGPSIVIATLILVFFGG